MDASKRAKLTQEIEDQQLEIRARLSKQLLDSLDDRRVVNRPWFPVVAAAALLSAGAAGGLVLIAAVKMIG